MVDPLTEATEKMTHPAPATPGGDVVGGSDKIGGGRIYSGAIPPTGPWRCPACSAENTGLISAGCQSCGSGSAQPRHVGVPPVAKGKGLQKIGISVESTKEVPRPAEEDGGFEQWFTRRFSAEEAIGMARLKELLRETWMAAWKAAVRNLVGEPPPTAAEPAPTTTVAIEKAILERLIVALQEEVTEDEVQSLIAYLREILE